MVRTSAAEHYNWAKGGSARKAQNTRACSEQKAPGCRSAWGPGPNTAFAEPPARSSCESARYSSEPGCSRTMALDPPGPVFAMRAAKPKRRTACSKNLAQAPPQEEQRAAQCGTAWRQLSEN